MKVRLEGITILANNVARLAKFYHEVIGFPLVVNNEHYAEFENNGVRVAICDRVLMAENTDNHQSYIEQLKGQAFELNFECDSPDEVLELYEQFVTQGAIAITEPRVKSWGHTTGFFADPEGNIHSIFALNPVEKDVK